jgi:hypothetical protein
MIVDHLPRYYEAHGTTTTHRTLESWAQGGHEVAWMEFDRTEDPVDQKHPANGCRLYCECDFTQDVSWKLEDGHIRRLPFRCATRRRIARIRQLELRTHYVDRFNTSLLGGNEPILSKYVPKIILDLIERVKECEFIGEDDASARNAGAYLSLDTVSAITGIPRLFDEADLLVAEKKIRRHGAFILPPEM